MGGKMKDFFSSFIFSGERDILVLGTQSFTLLKTDLNQDINIDFAFSRCHKRIFVVNMCYFLIRAIEIPLIKCSIKALAKHKLNMMMKPLMEI